MLNQLKLHSSGSTSCLAKFHEFIKIKGVIDFPRALSFIGFVQCKNLKPYFFDRESMKYDATAKIYICHIYAIVRVDSALCTVQSVMCGLWSVLLFATVYYSVLLLMCTDL